MACIICGSDGYNIIGKKGEFTIVRCISCEFVYTVPIPEEAELIKFYSPKEKPQDFKPHSSIGRAIKYHFFASRIKRFFPRNKQIRLLEIGCSQGDLLNAVKSDKQITAMGIDLNDAALNYAQSLGLNVFKGTLESLKFPNESFDVVVAIHVIEHLYDPIATINEINRILTGGGILISIVPCVTHIKAKLAGIKWKYFGPPGHLWYFSPMTFNILLRKTGFIPMYSSCFYNRAHLKAIAKKQ